MAYEQVDVYVEQEGKSGVPVDGVLVRAYSPDGSMLFGEATTDEEGRAGFLLAAQDYSLRFAKFQVGFTQPQVISVETAPTTPGKTLNEFTVFARVLDKPLATDPRLCRVSGFVRDASGAPRRNLDVHFIADFRPLILDQALVMDERSRMKTDKGGFGCVDLIRCACYTVTVEAFEDVQLFVRIPDAPCANLADVLFPVIETVNNLAPLQLDVNEEQELFPEVVDSVGIPLDGTARNGLLWSVDDPTIAQLTVSNTRILVRGLTAGTTELRAARRDSSVVRIPDKGIEGLPVSITVG